MPEFEQKISASLPPRRLNISGCGMGQLAKLAESYKLAFFEQQNSRLIETEFTVLCSSPLHEPD